MSVAFIRADTLYAWKGPSLLVTTARGACGDDHELSGFYYRETRVLRTLSLRINGHAPWLCDAAMVTPDTLALTYVHPEITTPGGGGTGQAGEEEGPGQDGIPERGLDIRASYRVGVGGLEATFLIANRALRTLDFEISCTLNADFADIQEAQAMRREQHAASTAKAHPGFVEFTYAHPQLPFRSAVHHTDAWQWRGDSLAGRITLAPQQQLQLPLRVAAIVAGSTLSDADVREREAVLDRWRSRFATVRAPGNRLFEKVIEHNVRDFASFPMLDGDPREWLAMQAGMPVYPAFFGRDAVTAGWQAGYVDHGEALEAALTKLARMQSNRVDDWRDEEPGRIPYQVRVGPLALLNINPYSAYYADFASPLMFVIALANLYAWTGDERRIRPFWDTVRRILDWAREYGDADRDGYLEYQTRSEKGTKNQGWKDSGDAIIYEDGSPVPSPIATCEIQGYWYVAQELMAVLCAMLGTPADAIAYRDSASDLKRRFNRDWWLDDEQCVALALDPDKRCVRAVTSNAGHCLATGIIDRAHLPALVGRLFAPDMFSGWGIRTLSSAHAFYNPISYHRGTVWGVEQGTIIFGLRRFGFNARAHDLTRAQFELAQFYPEYRIPECIAGYSRAEHPAPGAYPRANTPQLWNATALTLAVQTMLGIVPLAPVKTLLIDPDLPSWLPEVVLENLRVGDATVTLRFWRTGQGRSKWDVLRKKGTLHIVRQPPPESLTAGLADRLSGALESIA